MRRNNFIPLFERETVKEVIFYSYFVSLKKIGKQSCITNRQNNSFQIERYPTNLQIILLLDIAQK